MNDEYSVYDPTHLTYADRKVTKGDTDPNLVMGFKRVPQTMKQFMELEMLYKNTYVFYFLRDHSGILKGGISRKFANRLANLSTHYNNVMRGIAEYRCVELTSSLSPRLMETVTFFIAYYKGWKELMVEDNNIPLKGERVRDEDYIVRSMIENLVGMNNSKVFEFKLGDNTYWTKHDKVCSGMIITKGRCNILDHQQFDKFEENMRNPWTLVCMK
jgi:hypothetical protein